MRWNKVNLRSQANAKQQIAFIHAQLAPVPNNLILSKKVVISVSQKGVLLEDVLWMLGFFDHFSERSTTVISSLFLLFFFFDLTKWHFLGTCFLKGEPGLRADYNVFLLF